LRHRRRLQLTNRAADLLHVHGVHHTAFRDHFSTDELIKGANLVAARVSRGLADAEAPLMCTWEARTTCTCRHDPIWLQNRCHAPQAHAGFCSRLATQPAAVDGLNSCKD
jgi:hypothetical protein